METENEYKVGDRFIVEIAEIYASESKPTVGLRRSADKVYRMKGAIPLMREGQLRLLERVKDES